MNRYKLVRGYGSHTFRRKKPKRNITTQPGETVEAEEWELGDHWNKRFDLVKEDINKTDPKIKEAMNILPQGEEKWTDVKFIPIGRGRYNIFIADKQVNEKALFLKEAQMFVRKLKNEEISSPIPA